MKLTYQDRLDLKKALSKGYTLEYLANNTELTSYAIRKEVRAGLSSEEWELKLYGVYEPEKSIYSQISKIFDEDSIRAFVKWWNKNEQK